MTLQNLCTHLDCVRGKHERIVLVSDCYADSLADDGAIKEGKEFILKVETTDYPDSVYNDEHIMLMTLNH